MAVSSRRHEKPKSEPEAEGQDRYWTVWKYIGYSARSRRFDFHSSDCRFRRLEGRIFSAYRTATRVDLPVTVRYE